MYKIWIVDILASFNQFHRLLNFMNFVTPLFLNSRPFEINLSFGEKFILIQEMIQNHLTFFPGLLLISCGL